MGRVWNAGFRRRATASTTTKTMASSLHRRDDTSRACRTNYEEVLEHICWARVCCLWPLDRLGAKIWLIPLRSIRSLNIKHLESDYGEILDLTDRVGDVFDDRAPSGESRTSIVRVACYPPHPQGLRTAARFGSLMPESSARPKKRPMENSAPESTLHSLPPLPTIESWGSQKSSVTLKGANKRQKTQASWNRADEPDQEDAQLLLQNTRAEGSVQVSGSQEQPKRKCKSTLSLFATSLSVCNRSKSV